MKYTKEIGRKDEGTEKTREKDPPGFLHLDENMN
jgi:hypothetical protein